MTTPVGDITCQKTGVTEAVEPTVSTLTCLEPQGAVPTTASPEVVPAAAP